MKPNCQNFDTCGRNAKSKRSTLCTLCFKKQSRLSGAQSAGRKGGNPGNAGNSLTGVHKRLAGQRSGLRRSSVVALTIKKEWLDLILAGKKTWEIRGTPTQRRGYIHFAESGSGRLRGRCKLVACQRLERSTFMQHQSCHRVPDVNMVKYKNIWAWILEGAEPYDTPFEYSHKQGAVIFVTVRKPMGRPT